ncbi:MAG: hypothetical protein QOJ85_3872 [Solirubrobacteraceae bacterium]|jgi:hypothetical protein|nr:hypothetical protein [Solirubrobacteraceae bacterium]MEA2244672.1 hypothetical protein [Solirubrobacteraceae bacterium]
MRWLAPLVAAAWRLASDPLIGEALVSPTRDGERQPGRAGALLAFLLCLKEQGAEYTALGVEEL